MLKTAQSILRLFYFALSTFASCANLTSIRRVALALALLMVSISAPVKANVIVTETGVITRADLPSFQGPSLVGQPVTIIIDFGASPFMQDPSRCSPGVICYDTLQPQATLTIIAGV